MVLGTLGRMINADFERKKISKWQHCARCVYYLSIFKTRITNLKNTIHLQSNPPKRSIKG